MKRLALFLLLTLALSFGFSACEDVYFNQGTYIDRVSIPPNMVYHGEMASDYGSHYVFTPNTTKVYTIMLDPWDTMNLNLYHPSDMVNPLRSFSCTFTCYVSTLGTLTAGQDYYIDTFPANGMGMMFDIQIY